MKRYRCIRSSEGPSPFRRNCIYEGVEFNYGFKQYLRLKLPDGKEMNADAEDFVDADATLSEADAARAHVDPQQELF